MKLFSHEYLDKLTAEHTLTSACIARLKDAPAREYINRHNVTSVQQALNNLVIKKIELEVQIDILNEYLNT